MEILVRKPSEAEKTAMQKMPVWECETSTFDWYYDRAETCLLVTGDVTVEYDGGSAHFGAGDYVVLPKGLSCVWKVAQPVKKHYKFG